MALRRPPTRIDLKPEDMEEYDEVSVRQEFVKILPRFSGLTRSPSIFASSDLQRAQDGESRGFEFESKQTSESYQVR
jgi:hypothetical protein